MGGIQRIEDLREWSLRGLGFEDYKVILKIYTCNIANKKK